MASFAVMTGRSRSRAPRTREPFLRFCFPYPRKRSFKLIPHACGGRGLGQGRSGSVHLVSSVFVSKNSVKPRHTFMNDAANHTSKDAAAAQSILVVDDDPSMRTILSFSLKLLGYVVLMAGNGDEALTIARKHPAIRLIVLVVGMSGWRGQELAVQLKEAVPSP